MHVHRTPFILKFINSSVQCGVFKTVIKVVGHPLAQAFEHYNTQIKRHYIVCCMSTDPLIFHVHPLSMSLASSCVAFSMSPTCLMK